MVKVSVIGGGCLGIKIIGELAFHGHEVRVYDKNPESLDYVRLRLEEEKNLLSEDGLLLPSGFLGNVFYISRLEEAVKTSDFIFEVVSEDLALKQDLFEWISQCCKKDAVIASNSMSLNIDQICERASHKDRCLGVRFLFPVYCIPEVEVMPSSHTSINTLERVRNFLSRMGKVAFFRSGEDPLVLTAKQRESKKAEYFKNLRDKNSSLHKTSRTIPNLTNNGSIPKSAVVDLEDPSTKEKDCVVCMDGERNCVLHPCHHMCTCISCGRLLLKRQDACPMCRKHISSIFRVYHS